MGYRPRTYYSESQKALMWERWQKGDSLQQIAQLFDRNRSSVQGILVQSGGIRPAQRHRAALALTLAEREEISRAVAAGQSLRSGSARLGRAPSTISRELQRNGGPLRGRRPACGPSALSDELGRTLAAEKLETDDATYNERDATDACDGERFTEEHNAEYGGPDSTNPSPDSVGSSDWEMPQR